MRVALRPYVWGAKHSVSLGRGFEFSFGRTGFLDRDRKYSDPFAEVFRGYRIRI